MVQCYWVTGWKPCCITSNYVVKSLLLSFNIQFRLLRIRAFCPPAIDCWRNSFQHVCLWAWCKLTQSESHYWRVTKILIDGFGYSSGSTNVEPTRDMLIQCGDVWKFWPVIENESFHSRERESSLWWRFASCALIHFKLKIYIDSNLYLVDSE